MLPRYIGCSHIERYSKAVNYPWTISSWLPAARRPRKKRRYVQGGASLNWRGDTDGRNYRWWFFLSFFWEPRVTKYSDGLLDWKQSHQRIITSGDAMQAKKGNGPAFFYFYAKYTKVNFNIPIPNWIEEAIFDLHGCSALHECLWSNALLFLYGQCLMVKF